MPKPEVGQNVSVELKGKVLTVGHVDGEDEGHCDIELENGTKVTNVPTDDLKVHLPKKEKEEKAK